MGGDHIKFDESKVKAYNIGRFGVCGVHVNPSIADEGVLVKT